MSGYTPVIFLERANIPYGLTVIECQRGVGLMMEQAMYCQRMAAWNGQTIATPSTAVSARAGACCRFWNAVSKGASG